MREIEAGRPRLFAGTRGAWGRFFEDLFRSRYGVEIEHTHCMVDSELRSYREGGNSTVVAHIDGKYGVGTFDKALAEVAQFRMEYYETLTQEAEPDALGNSGSATQSSDSGITKGPPSVS